MRRGLAVGFLVAAVLALGLSPAPVQARKGGFRGGGRSFAAPSGRSYWSGRSSARPVSAPAGRSYIFGGGGRPATVVPAGKSYASGRTTTPVPPSTAGRTAPASAVRSGGRSYASGGSGNPARPAAGPRPGGARFDARAAAAQAREESRARFTKGQAPRAEYVDPKNTAHPIDPRDRRIQELRAQLDHERWVNRAQRERGFYRDYWGRPVVSYHDPYNGYFWLWLLNQDAQTRALWYYNHQQVVDQARYQELLNHDATLDARLRQLEAQGVPRDPAAVPPGVPPDLVYTDAYVNAAYNPRPPALAAFFWHGVRVLLYALVVIGILALLVWLVFFKRWGAVPG